MTDDTRPDPVLEARGTAVATAVLDAVDREPPEIRARLYAAIEAGRYEVRDEPDRVLAYFPDEKLAIDVALVASPLADRPRLVD